MLRHAPLVQTLVSYPSLGPSTLRLGERYAKLREAGLTSGDVFRGWNLIAVYALGSAIMEAPQASKRDAHGAGDGTLESQLAPPPPGDFTSESQFEHGLQRVLMGVLGRDAA